MTITGVHIWRTTTVSVEQTMNIGTVVGKLLRAGDVVGLVGDLGAGKTQLVRGIAAGMGVNPANVASPTFVIVHEYPKAPGVPVLVHVDAYRIKSLDDLTSIGWDLLGDSELRLGAVVVVEWADRLEGTLGEDLLEIELTHAGVNRRRLTIASHGRWGARMGALRQALDKIGVIGF